MVDKKKLMDVFEGVNISQKQKENLAEGIVEVVGEETKQYVDFEVEIIHDTSNSSIRAEIKSIFPHTAQKASLSSADALLSFTCNYYRSFEYEFAYKPVRFKIKDDRHTSTHHGIANVSIGNKTMMLVCPVFIDRNLDGVGNEDYYIFKWTDSI